MKSKSIISILGIASLLFLAAFGGGLAALKMVDQQDVVDKTEAVPAQQVRLSTSSSAPFDFTAAAEMATPGVVHISASESDDLAKQRLNQMRQNDPFTMLFGQGWFRNSPFENQFHRKQRSGSGVIINDEGYIVTNNHVIDFADQVEVTLSDKRVFNAEIIGRDPNTDLAVLKIQGENIPYVPLGNSDDVKVGQWVLAVGNPFSYLTSTVTAGIVSAKGRDLDIIGGGRNRGDSRNTIESFIQTDAAVNPGNSGGALVDATGRLVGINTAIATPTGTFAGYSFAIPVNLMMKIVDDIIEYGDVQRGYLGVVIAEMDGELADELGVSSTDGVFVQDVSEDGSAILAGVLPKDIIVAVNGKDINSVPDLQATVGSAKVGETLDLTLNRKGKIKDIAVRLKAL